MPLRTGAGAGGINAGVIVERVPGKGVFARSDMATTFQVRAERWAWTPMARRWTFKIGPVYLLRAMEGS